MKQMEKYLFHFQCFLKFLANGCKFIRFLFSLLLLHLTQTLTLDLAFFNQPIFFHFNKFLDSTPLVLQSDAVIQFFCKTTFLPFTFLSFTKIFFFRKRSYVT